MLHFSVLGMLKYDSLVGQLTNDDRDGEDDYSDMPAATIPPSVWQSANLQILCQPPQHWVGNKDKGSLV